MAYPIFNASEDYQKALEARGITCSMSRRGNCYDNAAMESWFGTLKTELGESFQSHADGKHQLFDYIELLQPEASPLRSWIRQPCGV